MVEMKFGYFPDPIDFTRGDLSVATLPDLEATRAAVKESEGVNGDWCFAPLATAQDFISGVIRTGPANGRVFGLPQTHVLAHRTSTDVGHLQFLVWMLGFIYGIRLTETEAGFLDATPITPGTFHDVVWSRGSEVEAIARADTHWHAHARDPRIAKGLMGVVHSLFLSQTPTLLDFERFIYLYTALDGCHSVRCAMKNEDATKGGHRKRIADLCDFVGCTTPDWADPCAHSKSGVRFVRNETLHEGLFFGEPWGFLTYGGKADTGNRSILLEMRCLVCRLLFGILGFNDPKYIKSPIDTRQRHVATLARR